MEQADLFPLQAAPFAAPTCQECGKTFSNDGSLRYHKLTAHRKKPFTKGELIPSGIIGEPSKARCTVCGVYCLPRNLNEHMKRHNNMEHVCVECGKIFKSQKDLNAHCEIHQSLQVVCPECGMGFRSKAVYRSHRARKHSTKTKPAQLRMCGVCKKQFHPDSLQKHIRRVHSMPTSASHACNVCKKQFACAQYLKRHMETHSDANSFSCKFCPKRFKTRRAMEWHRRKEHEDEERDKLPPQTPSGEALSVDVDPSSYSIPDEAMRPFCPLPLPSPLLTYSPNYSSAYFDSS